MLAPNMNMGVWLIKMMMIVIIIIIIIIIINNCIAKWRLGVWDIQELPLLAASSKMQTAPMAGKSWQPSHELLPRRGK